MCFGKKASAVDPAAVGPRPRSAGTTAAASVPADDRDITTQYQRLYLEDVRTWSRHFLAPPQSLPVFNPHEEQQLRTVVLINDLDAIMANDSLRRSTLEGLVGSHISRMLGQQNVSRASPEAVTTTLAGLGPIVLKFADTAVHETITAGLNEILRNAQTYLQTYNTHKDFMLVISNAKVNPANRLEFQPTFMEPREESGEGTGREVAILVFPGLFKVRQDTRVCMVKSKVLCRDDPGLQDLG